MSSSPNKKPRLNPARRRAAKEKGVGRSVKSKASIQENNDECIPAPVLNTKLIRSLPSRASVKLDASLRQSGNEEAAAKPTRKRPNIGKAYPTKACPNSTVTLLETPTFVTSGLVGCFAGAAMLLGAGLWSRTAGVDAAVLAARTSKMVANNLVDEGLINLKAGTYNAPEAFDMVRRTTLAYAGAIPGGIPIVECLFREIDLIRKKRGGEVDRALLETRGKLTDAQRKGASATAMNVIVLQQIAKLSTCTSDATRDIVARNPGLRQYISVLAK